MLAGHGYERRGTSWFKPLDEAILVVNLQQSQSWDQYINLGVFYRKFAKTLRPKITDCHVWTRMELVVPHTPAGPDTLIPGVFTLVDPNTPISADDRQRELEQLMLAYAIPWLDGVSTLETARSFLNVQRTRPAFIAPTMRAQLE